MIKFIKKEIEIEESLKQRIMIICDFCNTTPTIINGSIRKIDKTNWRDSTIFNILTNEICKGDFVHNKRTKNPTYYIDAVEVLVSKEFLEKFIEFLQDKIFFTNKYDDFINALYSEDILKY